jgi:hypothetical protein
VPSRLPIRRDTTPLCNATVPVWVESRSPEYPTPTHHKVLVAGTTLFVLLTVFCFPWGFATNYRPIFDRPPGWPIDYGRLAVQSFLVVLVTAVGVVVTRPRG